MKASKEATLSDSLGASTQEAEGGDFATLHSKTLWGGERGSEIVHR